MTLFTLDTNAVAAILRGAPDVVTRMARSLEQGHRVTLNAISYFEVRRGLELPQFQRKFEVFSTFVGLHGVLMLDEVALDAASGIYQDLRRRGLLIEDADILIAATALAHDAILVTRNRKHFERVAGLRLESWEA